MPLELLILLGLDNICILCLPHNPQLKYKQKFGVDWISLREVCSLLR